MSAIPFKKHRLIDSDECNTSSDPVRRLVRDLSAEATTEWLIECHGLSEYSRDNVISNTREQYRWHRLQGRLDQTPWLAVLAQLWGLRQEVKALERPPLKEAGPA